jgi:hypothetical protein
VTEDARIVRTAHPERFSDIDRRFRRLHAAKRAAASMAWRAKNSNRVRDNYAAWCAANPTYKADRYNKDISFRLRETLRSRLYQALARGYKAGSAVRDLGCTIPELKAWLEAKFYAHPETGESMSWDNYSLKGWHIDHERPLASFDLTDREQFLQACHYTNLQPLWAEQNLAKGAREAV